MPSGRYAGTPKRELNVLLFSPLRGLDSQSGDLSYTESLLAEPPPGVTYTTYLQALAEGSLRVRGRRRKHGPQRLVDAFILLFRVLESSLSGIVIYKEPMWFVSVDGRFDLVHSHLFSIVQVGPKVPVVSSSGMPLSVLYQERERWGGPRRWIADVWRRATTWLFRGHTPGLLCQPPDLLTVYTEEYARQVGGRHHCDVQVLGQYLPDQPRPSTQRPYGPVRLGFVGGDFLRKGGDLALEAVRLLRQRGFPAELVVVSADPMAPELVGQSGLNYFAPGASHAEVVDVILPGLDLLMLPSRADCGAPVTVMEALRAGVPVLVADGRWLDPRLAAPAAIVCARDPDSIATAIERHERQLLDGELGRSALRLFQAEFSAATQKNRYRDMYDLVLSRWGRA